MATIKSFTSLEQSKKLAEILPIESADMRYICIDICKELKYMPEPRFIKSIPDHADEYDVNAWSLSALLCVIRETIGYTIYGVNNVYMSCDLGDKPWKLETEVYDNEIDACVDMIEKLNELNLL
jgi:hypothetical protein